MINKTYLKGLIDKFYQSSLITKITSIIKYSSYFYGIYKGIRIFFHLMKIISFLMAGSFVAALYALIDFKAEFTDLLVYLIQLKDYILTFIIKVYSTLISNTDTATVDKPDPNTVVKKKTLIKEMAVSR